MDDFEPAPPLSEKRRQYFAARDKYFADKKGFRKLEVSSGPGGPQFIMVLLCLLGIALVAFQLFGPALYKDESEDITDTFPGEELEEQIGPGVRLDPDLMQSQLIRLEVALFDPAPASSFDEIVSGLIFEIDRMSEFLKSSRELRQEALANELDAMAGVVRADDFKLNDLASIQQQWLQIRAKSFQSAKWFRRPARLKPSAQATFTVYRDAADQLLRHVGGGITEAEDTIEENEGIGTLEQDQVARRELLSQWQESAEEWQLELKSIEELLPDRPDASASGEILEALHRLETALAAGQNQMPTDRFPNAADLLLMEEALARAQYAVEGFEELQ